MKTIMTQAEREVKILRVGDQEARVQVATGEAVYVPKAEFKKAHPEKKGPTETKKKGPRESKRFKHWHEEPKNEL